MTLEMFEDLTVPIIVACCWCIGFIMKKWLPTDDKWIPTVLLFIGGISGFILGGLDYKNIVAGMISGLAAVGVHQVFHQQTKNPIGYDELYSRGPGEDFEEDKDVD